MGSAESRLRLGNLLCERSFENRRVILASGRESDFFIDCKQTVLGAEGHALVGELLFEATASFESVEAVAGVELGGCPLASAVSLVSFQKGRPLDAIFVRKSSKEHGSKRLLEGSDSVAKGAACVVLEDVVTTGGSTLLAIEKLIQGGLRVVGVVVLVDRLEGGREAIEAAGYPVRVVFTRDDFLPRP